MQAHISTLRPAKKKQSHNNIPVTDSGVWNMLQSAGMLQISELVNTIHDIAPKPGSLVVLDVKKLPFKWDDWQPVLFFAADVCTHLQVARMYVTPTLASAIDFLQFLVERYPFPVKEIRTSADPVFVNPGSLQSKHQFTAEAKRLGIFHSVVLDQKDHSVLRMVSRYNYGQTVNMPNSEITKDSAVNGLINFLFFHNNHRSLASLGGLTPLQKLHSFEGYENIPWFDPYVSNEMRRAGNG